MKWTPVGTHRTCVWRVRVADLSAGTWVYAVGANAGCYLRANRRGLCAVLDSKLYGACVDRISFHCIGKDTFPRDISGANNGAISSSL